MWADFLLDRLINRLSETLTMLDASSLTHLAVELRLVDRKLHIIEVLTDVGHEISLCVGSLISEHLLLSLSLQLFLLSNDSAQVCSIDLVGSSLLCTSSVG